MSFVLDQILVNTILTGGLAIDVVRENGRYSVWGGAAYTHVKGTYSPTFGREYAQIKHFPGQTTRWSLAHTNLHSGAYQIILRYPPDMGGGYAKQMAETVMALFPVGTVVSYGGVSANIESSRRDGGAVVDGLYQIIVTINYSAFIGV